MLMILKFFVKSKLVDDALCFQYDPNRLNSGSKINKLYFNLSKYHVVHFSCSKNKFFLSIICWIMLFLQLLMRSAI